VRDALDQLGAPAGELRTIVVAGDREAASVLAADPTSVRTTVPDLGELTAWTAAIWVAPVEPGGAVGRGAPDALVRAALVGLPVVLAAAAAPSVGALADRHLTVARPDDADAWIARLGPLLDEEHRSVASARARTTADAIHGAAAAGLVVDRFLGWAGRAR
jgi:hypothetical protein